MARKPSEWIAADIEANFKRTRPHGIWDTKFTAIDNSTTEQSFSIEPSFSGLNILCAVRKAGANGDVEWLSSSSAIKITLSTGTVTGTVAGITVTGAYELYAYAISDNGALILGLSRSPYHKAVPANYYHTNTASARTAVGTPSTAWDAMWISKSGTINVTNSCVCLGLIGTVTFDGTNGRASSSALAAGAMPSFNDLSNWGKSPLFEYTPIFVGLGAVSSLKACYTEQGDTQKVTIRVTTGSVTGDTVQISLANSRRIDFGKISSGTVVGRWARNASASPYYMVVNSSDLNNVRVTNTAGLSETTGLSFANSEVQSIEFEVPILR